MNAEALTVDSIRPFLPAKDFAASKRFYQLLGFKVEAEFDDGGGAILSFGRSTFILQNFFVKELAENFMMQLIVTDIDAWWKHIQAAKLEEKFPVPAPKPPVMQPWGILVSYVVDPSGVLWHVIPSRE
jgi:catechol 2,3-dioxygenase-like lactoylglutathione lyase family enzyme